MTKKIAITGIGGYVGSAIAHELIAEGHHVIGVGHDENFSFFKNAFGEKVELISGDITDEKKLKDAFQDADVVIHTASPTTEKFCIEKPWEAFETIVYGTRAVSRAVRELHIPLLIHFSTQAVYMNFKPRELPLREDMEPWPDTVYGALKLAAEKELGDVPAFILRPANIYGINPLGIQRENVISRFVNAAKKGTPLIIKGDGLQRADYVHVRDVALVVKTLVMGVPPDSRVIINVGSGISRSIADIAESVTGVAEQNGFSKPAFQYEDVEGKVAADRVLLVDHLQSFLPEFPKISFEEGIRELFIQ